MSIQVVAHRGDSESARENTLEAFRAAIEAGADMVEIDIRTTADGVCVVLHDESLLRLWGSPHRVDELTLAQVRRLGSAVHRIPTLDETLELFAELNAARPHPVALLVDTTSAADVAIAVERVKALRASGRGELVPLAWCGDTRAMFLVRRELPEARISYNHEDPELDLAVVRELAPATVTVEWTLLTTALVDQVHRLGLQVGCWTLDDAWTMSLALEMGADLVTTNRPRLLRRLLGGGTSRLALVALGAEALADHAGIPLELARAVHVAHELATWANRFTRTAALGTISTKAHAADLVTAVDLAVEQHVRRVVEESFDGAHLVVGEEMGGRTEPGRPTWYLDPVDGTTNLANGLPWTSMSLALAIDGEPVVASVAQPALGQVFLAARGMGATLDGVPLRLGREHTLAGRTVLAELDAHALWPGMERLLDGLAAEHCTVRIMGSGTLALTGIAAGWAGAGVVHRSNPVDHLAGVLISHEAGAEVIGFDGRASLFPDGGGIVVAAPGLGQQVCSLLR